MVRNAAYAAFVNGWRTSVAVEKLSCAMCGRSPLPALRASVDGLGAVHLAVAFVHLAGDGRCGLGIYRVQQAPRVSDPTRRGDQVFNEVVAFAVRVTGSLGVIGAFKVLTSGPGLDRRPVHAALSVRAYVVL